MPFLNNMNCLPTISRSCEKFQIQWNSMLLRAWKSTNKFLHPFWTGTRATLTHGFSNYCLNALITTPGLHFNQPTYLRCTALHTIYYIHTYYLPTLTKWLLTIYNKYLRTRFAMHLSQSINKHWWSLQVADEIRICWRTEENVVELLSKLFAYQAFY